MGDERERRVGIRELKNRASRIVDEVREKKEPYVVTRRGEPVAVLRPWNDGDQRALRAQRVEAALASISRIAERVAERAGRRSAAAAVAGQRR